MFTDVIRLEFVKQRKAFLSVIFFGAIFLLFVIAESLTNNRNVLEVLGDIIGYFALMGMPALLILTGPVAAAQLRSESARNAEEPLPISPIQKVFGTYLTNLIYLLIGFFFFLIITLIFHPIHDFDLGFSLLRRDNAILVEIVLLAFQFHLLAFLFAYWINQTILGTAMAGLIIGSEILIVLLVDKLDHQFWFTIHQSSLVALTLSGIILGIIGEIAGLWIISKRVELNSRTFFWPGCAAAIAASIGVIILSSGFSINSYRLQNRLIPLNLTWAHTLLQSPSLKTGMLFYSASDDLVLVTPENKTVLRNTSFKLNPLREQDLIAYDVAKETSFFLFRKGFGKYEIWKEGPGGKFDSYCKFSSPSVVPEFMFQRDDRVSLYSFSHNENFIVFSKVSTASSDNKQLQWHKIPIANGSYGFPTIMDHVLKDAADQGRAARLSSSKKMLTRVLPDKTIMKWNLPGTAVTPKFLGTALQPAYEKDGQPYFVIPVNENGKISFVICSPDGLVKPAWKESGTYSDYELSPREIVGGGVAWIRVNNKSNEIRVIGKDGALYKPARIPADLFDYWTVPLKMEDSLMWVLSGKKLIKVDLNSGETLFNSGVLTDTANYWNNYSMTPTKEGLYFIRSNRICLIDWNGKIRELGLASVN
jgi:hypothetical protein